MRQITGHLLFIKSWKYVFFVPNSKNAKNLNDKEIITYIFSKSFTLKTL